MSKILVVQPHKMLQYAAIACLAPEHDVTVVGSLPATQTVAAYDIVIVEDALAVKFAPLSSYGRADRKFAIIQLKGEKPGESPGDSRLLTLNGPITRDNLRAAVNRALTGDVLATANATPKKPASQSRSKKATGSSGVPQKNDQTGAPNVIELVEVVGEAAAATEAE